jgi:enoyl-CoA hydratase/carnithine racemase
MSAVLLSEDRGPVRHLKLNRPEALNALNAELTDALCAQFEALYRLPAVRVVVLKGAGRAFCAGLDLKGFGVEGRGFSLALAADIRIAGESARRILRIADDAKVGRI